MSNLDSINENEVYEAEKMKRIMYYQEVKKYIVKTNSDFCSSIDLLFNTCTEYYLKYLMYCKIKDAQPILQNYMPSNNQLTNKNSELKQSHYQDIFTNLYAEFFAQLYDDYYSQQYSWNTVYNHQDLVSKILTEHLGKDNKIYIEHIKFAVYEKDKKINLSNFHSAMHDLEEAFSIPKPEEEDSVINVLTTEVLQNLYNYIQTENIAGAFIYSSALRIFLTSDRKYENYVGRYFNLKCNYDLNKLNRYFFGEKNDDGEEVEGLFTLLSLYKETMELLESFR